MANLGGPNMPALLIDPSYAELAQRTGQPMEVQVDGGRVRLWLECLSTPVTFDGHTTFTVRLTGPVQCPLGPGAHLLSTAKGEFMLVLEAVARDVRHLHYESYLTENAADHN